MPTVGPALSKQFIIAYTKGRPKKKKLAPTALCLTVGRIGTGNMGVINNLNRANYQDFNQNYNRI